VKAPRIAVAERVHVLRARAQLVVDVDVAALVGLDPGFGEASQSVFGTRPTAAHLRAVDLRATDS
jgi:hypothetical protein